MNRNATAKTIRSTTSLTALVVFALSTAGAQVPVDDDGNPIAAEISPLDGGVDIENPTLSGTIELSAADLDELVGPIALYPDDLLAIVLPASTYPLEIVQAARFLESAKLDSSLKPDEEWDDSIVALLNYPDVLTMMDEDIDWTWRLGEAVVEQQASVIGAIESFRDRAYAAGNLKSDEHQTVVVDDGVIEIDPVDDDVIYVPYYEPEEVIVYSPRPVYHYYPQPYPVYYYPYSNNHRFRSGLFWGVTTAFSVGWATDRLHVFHHSYRGHPYFGHHYYGPSWRRPSITVFNSFYGNHYRPRNRYRLGDYWRPRHRSGPRPRVRTTENYANRYRPEERGNRERRTDSLYQRGNNNRVIANNRRAVPRSAGDSRRQIRRTDESRRANVGQTNRAANRVRNRTSNTDGIRFRPRGNGAVSASPERRMRNATERTPRVEQPRRPRATETRRTPRATLDRRVNARQELPRRPANRQNRNRQTAAQPRGARSERRETTRNARPQLNRNPPAARQTARAQPQRQRSEIASSQRARKPARATVPRAEPKRRSNRSASGQSSGRDGGRQARSRSNDRSERRSNRRPRNN